MEKENLQIVFLPEANDVIGEVILYIEQKGFPETAEQYVLSMMDFAHSLTLFPGKYPLCRFPKFAKRYLRCAVFDHTYVFIYKVVKHQLIIYNVIHGKRLK